MLVNRSRHRVIRGHGERVRSSGSAWANVKMVNVPIKGNSFRFFFNRGAASRSHRNNYGVKTGWKFNTVRCFIKNCKIHVNRVVVWADHGHRPVPFRNTVPLKDCLFIIKLCIMDRICFCLMICIIIM